MSKNTSERKPIILTSASHWILHIAELSFPAVSLMVAQDLLGREKAYDKIGFAFFIFSLLFGITQILGGILADRLGPRKTIWIYLLGSGLSLIFLGFAQSFFKLTLWLGILGAFLGIYHPAGMSLLSHSTRKRGTAMGIHGMAGNFGLALSPFVASALAGAFGWRNGFMLLGLLPVLLSLFPLLETGLEIQDAHPAQKNPSASANTSFWILPVIILFLMSILNGMCYRGFTTFLPAYFNEKFPPELIPGFSRILQAGTFTTAVLVLGMLGQLIGGRLADRYSREKLFTTVFLLAAPFLFSLSFLSGFPLLFSAMTFAFFYFANQPIVNSLLPHYADSKVLGRLYGWFYFMNFGAGSIMSWIAGIIGQKLSLKYIFILFSMLLLITGLLGVFLILRTRHTGDNNHITNKNLR